MISEAFLSVFFDFVNSFLDLLPDITFTLDVSVFSGVLKFLHVIIWVLPCDTLISIMVIQISICVFRIVISIVKTIWNLIPFV